MQINIVNASSGDMIFLVKENFSEMDTKPTLTRCGYRTLTVFFWLSEAKTLFITESFHAQSHHHHQHHRHILLNESGLRY